uniref:Uncharacterized protein n=1 Tax=Lactuca sativa TaxID=4236 RepID=A0A9R1WRS9_LACSA|nr:hypothetical protein LSAT_V11C100018120 [Lactuca sativa]
MYVCMFVSFSLYLFSFVKMSPNIQKIVMEVNDDSSSSKDELINDNLLLVLSRTAQILLQNNASSSNIQRRNTIHRDCLEVKRLLTRHYFSDDSTYGYVQFRRRFHMSKGLFIRIILIFKQHGMQQIKEVLVHYKNAHRQYINKRRVITQTR